MKSGNTLCAVKYIVFRLRQNWTFSDFHVLPPGSKYFGLQSAGQRQNRARRIILQTYSGFISITCGTRLMFPACFDRFSLFNLLADIFMSFGRRAASDGYRNTRCGRIKTVNWIRTPSPPPSPRYKVGVVPTTDTETICIAHVYYNNNNICTRIILQ